MPLLEPWAWEATFAAGMLFPIAGVVADIRRGGLIHPAWRWGITVMLASFVLVESITYSSVGQALYRTVTWDSPGSRVAPLEFAAPPPGGLVTGRG